MSKQQQQVEKNVFNYYETKDVHDHYTKLWGPGNIHFGYFPNLYDLATTRQASYEDGARLLSYRMCEQGLINENSVVLDLGCGYGKPACDIAIKTGCKVIGIDLSQSHINEANKIVSSINNNSKTLKKIDCTFYVGSFLGYPKEVKNTKFTHIFTQVALCHAHAVCSIHLYIYHMYMRI